MRRQLPVNAFATAAVLARVSELLRAGVLVGFVCLANLAACRAQSDEVIIQGSTATSRITIRGDVLDYTGKKLVLKTAPSKPETTYSAADVVSVKTQHSDAHQAGLKALAQGQTEDAEVAFERATNQETRAWVRRELLALQLRCSLRKAEWVTAGQRFVRLYQSDADTRHIDLIPLWWTLKPTDAGVRGQAVQWLRDKQPLQQLLGASWLCFDPKYEAECEQVWPLLLRGSDERLRTLAQWQNVRRRVALEGVEESEQRRWEARVAKLDTTMRAGPYFLMGHGFASRHEFDLAAAAFLRLPLAHATDHPVTAEALLAAGRNLEKAGLPLDAKRLFIELIQKHGHTSYAAEAKRLTK